MHKHDIESHMDTLKPNGLGEHDKELAWSRIAMNLVSRKKPAISFSSFSRKVAAVLIVAVTLMGTGVLTASAHGTMPGDLLFPVKIATENVQIFLARDLQKKEALRIKFAEVRLAEVRALIDTTNSDGALNQALASSTQSTTGASTATSTTDGTTTLFLPKTTVKKIERAERAITIALRELEQTRAALLNSGSAESVLVIDDIIAELRGAGDGSVTITKIASGGNKKGDSEKVVLHATLTNTASTSSAFAGKVTINEKKNGATITINGASIKTQIAIKGGGATTTVKEKNKSTHREDDEDDEDDKDEDKHDADDRDRDRKDNKDEKKAKICHTADGKHHTIEVSVSSARAHLAHGDRLGECRDDDDDTPPVVDTTAPTLSGIAANPGTTTALISWATNEPARSQLFVGTANPVVTTAPNAEKTNLTSSHSFALTGLTPQTTYYYIVSSADAYGNRATSTQGSFTTGASGSVPPPPPADTTAPVISGVSVATTTSSARVSWNTNESASGVLFYGAGDPLGSSGAQISTGGLALTNDVLLSGLATSTTYQFLIVAKDAVGNTATSTPSSFAIE